MQPSEIEQFLRKHDLSNIDFAKLLGTTPMSVTHWLKGSRSMSLTMVRLLKMFDRKPELMKEFAQ